MTDDIKAIRDALADDELRELRTAADCAGLSQEFARLLDALEQASKDAERWRWLRSRRALALSSTRGTWTRLDGSTFEATHYLAEGETQHAPAPGLDATIDAAMLVAKMRDAAMSDAPGA